MTTRDGNVVMLEPEQPQQCDLCGKIAELRPYGPNGESICYECGMKDEAATKRQFLKRTGLDVAEHVVIIDLRKTP
jgi:hypothetical protein